VKACGGIQRFSWRLGPRRFTQPCLRVELHLLIENAGHAGSLIVDLIKNGGHDAACAKFSVQFLSVAVLRVYQPLERVVARADRNVCD